MQKKLLALAVAGALAPAAAMAQSTVEIYGRANLGIDSWKAEGATAGSARDYPRRTRVYDTGSRVGFRVNEGLGGGMRAFVVIETGVNIDAGGTNGQSGSTNGSTGTWATRDSYVGLGGGWGDVRFGRQSIWWSNGVIAQTGANYINTAADSVINTPGGGVSAPVTRQSSVVSYNTPTFGGFNASLSYSPHDQEGASYTGAAGQKKGYVLGGTARYRGGPLRAQFDLAKRKNAGNVEDRDLTGTKLGVGWAYAPGSQISAIIGQLKSNSVAAMTLGDGSVYTVGGEDLKRNFWLLNWEHMIGPWQLLAQFYQGAKIKGLADDSDTKVRAWTLAAKYFLSKRTGVYASYTQIRNEDRAWADIIGAGYSSAAGGGLSALNAGADPKMLAVGIQHNF